MSNSTNLRASDSNEGAPPTKPEWAMSKGEAERARRRAEGLPPKRRKWPWIVALLIVGGSGYAYYAAQNATSQSAAVPPPETPVAVMQVNTVEMTELKPRTLQRTVKVIGTLDPLRRAQLSSQVNGRIEEVLVQPGDAVMRGDVLVQVDVETLTLELEQVKSNTAATRAQLELAEVQLQRVKALIARGVSTTSNLDESESNVRGLRASVSALEDQVAGAELRLRNATVTAPFDGAVSARDAEPGQYVSIGAPLVTVVDLTSVEMHANAPVGAGSLLSRGQTVGIHVDGITNRDFVGTVTRINPVAEEGTRTIPVYVLIDNADKILLGGMFATGQIVVEEVSDALAVPTVALREDAQGYHLLIIENGTLRAQPVETGGEWAGRLTQIKAGLMPGQQVVTAPLPELTDGDAVEIVED